MKTKSKEWIRTSVRVLTEVPGWPDAPVSARARRALPVVLPCIGMLLLLVWNLALHAPRVRAQRAELQPLVALESGISTRRLGFSEQQVAEIAERAAAANRLLLEQAKLAEFLRALKQEAADRGWEASFFPSDAGDPAEGAVLRYIPVRGKMTPSRGNTDSFTSFMGWLERFSSSGKRIDLIRLVVRADERRWNLVELNFRLASPLTNEKTP